MELSDFDTLETRAVVWGEVIFICKKRLEVTALSGAKDFFTNSVGPDGKPWEPLAHPRPNGGAKPLQDKGLLKASMSAMVTEEGLRLSASSPGANVHQFGATLKPTKAKHLSIPLTKEAKRVGGARHFPRKLFPMTGPRATVLAERTGKGKRAKVVVHYVLKEQVTVHKREFVGFSAATLDKIGTIIAVSFEERLMMTLEGKRAAHFAANPLIS